ncbi:MAG: NAD(P)H-dependent oxidoreductase [Candidatus Syntrophosphaera sp.]|nr:NAD(P)H-dependent oxidoreductase [Candidatus Syntrophosphaera sp.]
MNVSILICSHSGNTLKLGEQVSDILMQAGHQVNLTTLASEPRLDPKKPTPAKDFKITNLPDLSGADIVLVGGPVWGFRPCPLLIKAMDSLGGRLTGKKVLTFVTHSFPWAWMTGNSSLNSLRRLAANAGAQVAGGVVLSGAGRRNMDSYAATARKIAALVK